MGNESKKTKVGQRDDLQQDTPYRSILPKKANTKMQSGDGTTPKRKRKSTEHVKPSLVPSSPQPNDASPPSKRTKLVNSPQETNGADRNIENVPITAIANSPSHTSVNSEPENDSATPSGKSKMQSTPKSNKKMASAPTENLGEEQGTPTLPARVFNGVSTEVRKGKRKQDGRGHTGFFSSDEVQAIERFKIEFCNSNGYSGPAFDAMVQHSERDRGNTFPCDPSIITKPEFWKTIYGILPTREKRSVYRFMRRHFQTSDVKPHQWTHEQDEELIQLVARYGLKFAQIAKEIGRSDDDVVQRWKNRLEHRTTMNRGPWSEEEIRGLQNALQVAWKNLKGKGHDVGRDIYEMDETLISWGHISNKIGNCRSRQQCADKWRKARKKVKQLRDTENPDAVLDPAQAAKKAGPKASSNTPSPPYPSKSAEYVGSDDDDDSENEGKITKSGKSSSAKKGFAPGQKSILPGDTKSPSESESSASDTESQSTDESDSDIADDADSLAPEQQNSGETPKQPDKKAQDTAKDLKSAAKSHETPKAVDSAQVTEDKSTTKTALQKRKRSTVTSSSSEAEDSDSSSSSDSPAPKRVMTNGPKTSRANQKSSNTKAPKVKEEKKESSSEDNLSETSSSDERSEGSEESDDSESEVTSSSDNDKTKSLKVLPTTVTGKQSPSSEEASEDESEGGSDSSESESDSHPVSKSSKSNKKVSQEMDVRKQGRSEERSTSSARSSISRDVKSEDSSQ
ncbi:hypothetical protein BDV28DRAFT_133520 [Aspergillus coremiiformis]|uniref:Myb-like DNA-binding domain protein n=1 Tax=Aspergillus coremiiformis TaxID=138285 RepID=A0A5N6Z8R4_9EURO|nr:hypothetical protein BDV28DRAFT_133520 [Aspergillus coremiiformis]